MHRAFAAGVAILLSMGLPAAGEDTPKRGGTLTFMIPADSPPSFDGHRENTFATIHAVAPFYSVLIRANPDNPADTTEFVCDVCTEIPKPTDGGRTYAFPIRGDVRFQDGSPLTAYDVAASWNKIVDPPEGVISVRRGYYSMIDKVEAPDAKTVVFHLKFATAAFLPALADPYAFIYKKAILDRDPHWFEKNIMGSGPFRFKEYQAGSVDFRRAQSGLLPAGTALSGRLHRHLRRQAGDAGRARSAADRAAIEFRGFPPATRDELSAALGDKITVQESDWNCGALITPNHAEKAVRRCAGAPRADPGDRPLAWRAGDGADHGHADRRRRRVSRLAAGRDQGGTGAIGRLLAGHREVARRGEAAVEGSRRRRADLRAAQPQCRPALQIQWHLGHRRMEQDRRQGDPARVADRAL